jgi:hypothetical protein
MMQVAHRGVGLFAGALVLAALGTASADPVKCERTIAKASQKFVDEKAKALQKCEDEIAAGALTPDTDCHADSSTAKSIQRALMKLTTDIAKDCGGRDKTCGTSDDDALSGIGWGATTVCPNFENGSCTNAIANCQDIVSCLNCVGEAAVDQAITLYYGDLATDAFGTNSPVNKCQRSIGKETTKFLRSKSKALAQCWDARLKGKHSNPCPDPGDGQAATSIRKAEQKKVENICKACGGADKICGTSDDLTPADIGFVSTCPDVTVPGAPSSCARPVEDLADIVACVDCVTEFKVDCVDRLAVPGLASYPPECNAGASTTTTTSSTTTSTTLVTCGNGVVDPGEPCDPTSPTGAFLCEPGETCSATCMCVPPSTTTTTTEASTTTTEAPTTTTEAPTTTTTSSTTTTTQPNLCGNGMVDPGEPCDPTSPGGAFLCEPGQTCSAECTCVSPSTTTTAPTTTTEAPTTTTEVPTTTTEAPTTTTEAVTTTTSSSTTSTTAPNLCGNGMVDPGEPCDPSSPGGAFLCNPGETCSAECTCLPPPTTTTEVPTTTTEAPTTTTEAPTTTTEAPTTTTEAVTTTTTTTLPSTCGNGMVDPGEPCDPSSPGGAFLCSPGDACSPECSCVPG